MHICANTYEKKNLCPMAHSPEITSVHVLSQGHVKAPHDAFNREIISFIIHTRN